MSLPGLQTCSQQGGLLLASWSCELLAGKKDGLKTLCSHSGY